MKQIKDKPVQVCLFKREGCTENPASLRGYHMMRYLLDGYNMPMEERDGKIFYTAENAEYASDMLELIQERVGGRYCNWHCSVRVYCYELAIIKEHYGGSRTRED